MIEDAELLRRYAQAGSQEAFAELVRRRVDLVYTVALRQVGGDAHLAQDVTQKVFVDLARKAGELASRAVLSGWLYRSTQFAASDVVRSERRRRTREQESHAMQETSRTPHSAADWEKLRPLLDEAMGELADDDRDAVALRFFEERPFAEIGRALRLTEEAARKRVERALDRLAAALSRRGVTSTATALGLALANQALVAAPAGLATTITGAALAGGVAATAGTGALAGGLVFGFMSATKTTVGIAAAVAVLATGGAIYGFRSAEEGRAVLAAAEREQQQAQAKLSELEQRVKAASQRAQAAEADTQTLLKAIADAKRSAESVAPPAPPSGPVTYEMVQSRYRRAQELARNGQWAQALPELLWCYDDGMKQVSNYSGVRVSFLLSEIGKMAQNYPPARAALEERRARAEQRLMADREDNEATWDYAALNEYLDEGARTLELYDRLPRDDPRRRGLASRLFETLLGAKRYADAVEANPYDKMVSLFERTNEPPPSAAVSDRERMQRELRRLSVATAARNIEALAGAGELANARAFVERVLRYDDSPETRAVLREHLGRVGQGDLLNGAGQR